MRQKITIFSTLLALSIAFHPNFISQSHASKQVANLFPEETSGTDIPVDSYIESNASPTTLESFGNQPLFFIQNDDQLDEKVKYYEIGSGHATYFTRDGIYLSLSRQKETLDTPAFPLEENAPEIQPELLKLSFLNANKNPKLVAEKIQKTRFNYFIGRNPERWKSDIPTYSSVNYKEIYKDIDLKVYGNNRQLEYDVVIKPGGNPGVVKFRYEGASSLAVNQQGELEIELDHGTITQKAPYLYQEIDGRKIEVSGSFKLLADNSYTFKIDSYDTSKQLVIDPVIEYSKYVGGTYFETGNAITLDSQGNAYITGTTESLDFPGSGKIYSFDAFVTKIDTSGVIEYSTIFGGRAEDWITGAIREAGNDIAVDSSGNVHVTGSTTSTDFSTTTGAIQSSLAGNQIQTHADAFYTVLTPSGNMSYSSYLGGSNIDLGHAIAVDDSGNALIAGSTGRFHYSIPSSFPVVNALQSTHGGGDNYSTSYYPPDGFVTKIHFDAAAPSNTSIVFSTYFGGNDNDAIGGLALDNSGNIYITGSTRSTNLPGASTSLIQPTFGGSSDAFVTKISAPGDAILYSTYLGGNRTDYGTAIDVDSAGSAYLTGYINNPSTIPPTVYNFPLVNPIQTASAGEKDAFVTKINAAGNSIDYSSLLGGNSSDRGLDIAVDSSGSAYVAGSTSSSLDFPIFNPINGHGQMLGISDGFIVRLTPSGAGILYSTFFGGDEGTDPYAEPGADHALGIAVDDNGNAYITGQTNSHCLPAPEAGNAPSCIAGFGGHTDAFIAKISDNTQIPPEVISVSPADGEVDVAIVGTVITATFNKAMNTTSFTGNFTLSTGGTPVPGTVGNSGTQTATFTPSAELSNSTLYKATLTTGVEDAGGAPLLADYSWEFTAGLDTTPPTILSTNPITDSGFTDPPPDPTVDVPVDTVVTVTFSEDMAPASITASSFNLQIWSDAAADYILIAGTVSYDSPSQTATFTPDTDFPYSTWISLVVQNTATDLAGNPLYISSDLPFPISTYQGSFQTACDPLGPAIASSSPMPGAVDTPVDTAISITFDKDITPETIDQNTFTLYTYPDFNTTIPGSASYDVSTRTLTFTPNAPLQNDTAYYGIVSNNFTDTEGRILCNNFGLYFTTIATGNYADTDNDGIPDNIEDTNLNGTVDPGETDPDNPDTDGDGLLDGIEDTNRNGVVDPGETNPTRRDTDGDGFSDGYEVTRGSDPLDPLSIPAIRAMPWLPLLLQ